MDFSRLISNCFQKSILVFVFLFGFAAAIAQNAGGDINFTDSKGLKQGVWRKTDAKGVLIYEGQFKNNIPQGSFTYYYEDGKIRSQLNYSMDGKVALAVNFYPSGKKMAAGTYRETKKSGIWKYYTENEILAAEETYENGKPAGIWKKFYEDGKILEECPYANGLKEGISKQYFSDGSLKSEIHFQKGKYEGNAIFNFVDGKPMLVGQFSNDMKHGKWIAYKANGEKESETTYQLGEVIEELYYDKAREAELNQEVKAIPE